MSGGADGRAERCDYLHLFGGPHVEIDGFDAANVRAHAAVET